MKNGALKFLTLTLLNEKQQRMKEINFQIAIGTEIINLFLKKNSKRSIYTWSKISNITGKQVAILL